MNLPMENKLRTCGTCSSLSNIYILRPLNVRLTTFFKKKHLLPSENPKLSITGSRALILKKGVPSLISSDKIRPRRLDNTAYTFPRTSAGACNSQVYMARERRGDHFKNACRQESRTVVIIWPESNDTCLSKYRENYKKKCRMSFVLLSVSSKFNANSSKMNATPDMGSAHKGPAAVAS
jgi:hypothetical protein